MEIHLLLVSLLVIIPISSAIQTIVPLVMPNSHEDNNQKVEEETLPNQQKSILEFLSAFDEVQKSTNHQLITKTTKFQAHAKIFGKTIKRDVLSKGQTSPHFSQQQGIVESSKDFLKTYPLTRKNLQKATLQPSKKSKKRACFWKYCVQSK